MRVTVTLSQTMMNTVVWGYFPMMPGSSADVPEAQITDFKAAPALSNIATSEALLLGGRTGARARSSFQS